MALFGKKTEEKKTSRDTASVKTVQAVPTRKKKSMHATQFSHILRRPRITEKALRATEQSVYVFDVAMRATKAEVAKAVLVQYDKKPVKVHLVRVAPRATVSRMRRRRGTSAGYKKAYVYLTKGEKIDLM